MTRHDLTRKRCRMRAAVLCCAVQDVAFRPALLLALCIAAFQLVMRTVTWDSRRKKVRMWVRGSAGLPARVPMRGRGLCE